MQSDRRLARVAGPLVALVLLGLPILRSPAPVAGPAADVPTLLAGLKVMSYYPSRNGWSYMWSRWNPATIDADFTRIARLHANTVRIIVHAATFGYPAPQPIMLKRLAWAITRAGRHRLRVQLTLFDGWNAYGDVSGSKQWARALIGPYAGDPRVAFVELQNEINPANAAALAWARQMVPYVRSVDGGIPVTLSVSGSAGLSGLHTLVAALQSSPLDFYTFHYYGTAALAYATFGRAVHIVAPTPLFIGEIGTSTCTCSPVTGLPATQAALEAYQDQYYRTVAYSTRLLGLPAPVPWILSDFFPGAIPGGSQPREYGFGLYRLDNTLKPAGRSVRAFFGQGTIDLSFNNGFESGFDTPTGRLPADWRIDHQSEGTFAQDTTVAHSGDASARISGSGGDPTGVPAFYVSPINAAVEPGRVYTASAWVRGLDATGATRVSLNWFDASGNYMGQVESPWLPTGTTPWTQLTARGPAPDGAAYTQINLKSSDNTGTVWFDDVSFR